MISSLHAVYRHCCYCGGELKHVDGYSYSCLTCKKNSFLSPVLGCNCILIQDNSVLMTKRARNPDAGTWALPGGFAHPEETCSATMIREVKEELDLTISVDCLIGSDCCMYDYQDVSRPVTVVYGLGRIISGDITCMDDVCEYAWLTLEELQSRPLFHPFEVQMIQEAFAYRMKI